MKSATIGRRISLLTLGHGTSTVDRQVLAHRLTRASGAQLVGYGAEGGGSGVSLGGECHNMACKYGANPCCRAFYGSEMSTIASKHSPAPSHCQPATFCLSSSHASSTVLTGYSDASTTATSRRVNCLANR
jgi:hypothetical protein